MSQAELVDAVTQHIWETAGTMSGFSESTYAKYERGVARWPSAAYREALRHVLGVDANVDLGFAPTPRGHTAASPPPVASPRQDFTDAEDDPVDRRDFFKVIALGTGAATTERLATDGVPEHAPVNDGRRYGLSDVARVRAAVSGFSRADQKHGGGHGFEAAAHYFTSDMRAMLNGRYASSATRQAMYSAAAELSYVIGWMAFDDAKHPVARRYFTLSVDLAGQAHDPALAGHTLRAMAHQDIELGRIREAVELAERSVSGRPYEVACPRERSLFGVVHARALAAAGLNGGASAALLRAEDDLRKASPGDDEPGRVYFFSEASLAHETGRTLFSGGDVRGAESALSRSVRVRAKQPFARTHAVTLGYLGEAQAARGNLDQACATWSDALDAMDGVRSARARQTVETMRGILQPAALGADPAMSELDHRAATCLAGS